jgi:Kef-type K+ transport system membrane component KefB
MLTEHLIINLLLILAVSWLFGSFFERFGLPVMLGQLLAGLVLGPSFLGVVRSSPPLEFLAELGIFFAMFYAGMEMDPKELLKHIWPSLGVALGGFLLPFGLGYLVTKIFGGTLYQALFVGMGLSITAIAVQAVILQNLQIHQTKVGTVIIGAAIADDILSLIALSVLLGLVKSGNVQFAELVMIIIKVILFFVFTILTGHFIIPTLTNKLDDYGGKGFTFALLAALIMACAAELAGLHYVIGAFLAGQFVRKEMMDEKIYLAISDRFFGLSYGFLMPIFFATLTFQLQFSWDPGFLVFAAVITVVAVIGKLVGCGLGAKLFGYTRDESMVIGFGMNGRGAVELVVVAVIIKLSNELLATGRLTEPLLTPDQISTLVLMAFITTLMAPIMLRWSVRRVCGKDPESSVCPRL